FDIPAGEYPIEIYDADNPSLLLETINVYGFNNRLNYLIVFFPPQPDENNLETTDYRIFDSGTSRTPPARAASFVNAAATAGPVTITLDGQVQVRNLEVGDVLGPVPVSKLGNDIVITQQDGQQAYTDKSALWSMADSGTDKIIILFDRVTDDPL